MAILKNKWVLTAAPSGSKMCLATSGCTIFMFYDSIDCGKHCQWVSQPPPFSFSCFMHSSFETLLHAQTRMMISNSGLAASGREILLSNDRHLLLDHTEWISRSPSLSFSSCTPSSAFLFMKIAWYDSDTWRKLVHIVFYISKDSPFNGDHLVKRWASVDNVWWTSYILLHMLKSDSMYVYEENNVWNAHHRCKTLSVHVV